MLLNPVEVTDFWLWTAKNICWNSFWGLSTLVIVNHLNPWMTAVIRLLHRWHRRVSVVCQLENKWETIVKVGIRRQIHSKVWRPGNRARRAISDRYDRQIQYWQLSTSESRNWYSIQELWETNWITILPAFRKTKPLSKWQAWHGFSKLRNGIENQDCSSVSKNLVVMDSQDWLWWIERQDRLETELVSCNYLKLILKYFRKKCIRKYLKISIRSQLKEMITVSSAQSAKYPCCSFRAGIPQLVWDVS